MPAPYKTCVYCVRVLVGVLASLTTLAGVACCFLFGLLPILDAIDAGHNLVTRLFLIWLLGVLALLHSVHGVVAEARHTATGGARGS